MKKVHHRMATWWMHWEDLNWPDGDNLDKIKARAEGFAKADVTAAMFFGAHFRWDFLPVLPLLHDYIATVAEELHKNGVLLFDHHSVNLVHRYSTREEMRRVMLDSGPHLPFSPTREAAASWEFNGKRLNDWRMIDVKDGNPLYFPQYTAEGFCHRNPEFREAYQDYVKLLIRDTGIDGLSADDAMYFMQYNACGCPHCRAELQRRAGIDLPPVTDSDFWGNWDNPAWKHWLDLRFDASGGFYEDLRKTLPEDFILTGCGASSASASALMSATDARTFLRGWNYVNMEMSGNTPPYKHDPKTVNVPVPTRLINASHHQAAAREKDVRAFCTGFAHSTTGANHVWAVSKILDADAWIGTLKARLGLPRHLWSTIPSEQDIVGQAFGFEKEHPELFDGAFVGQLGVYFSYETRNHTMFGNLNQGYYQDYGAALRLLFQNGICPHTLFAIPKTPEAYPILLLSSVAAMTEPEQQALQAYIDAGGQVVVTGPTPLSICKHSWNLPNTPNVPPEEFFTTVPDGVHIQHAAWVRQALPEDAGDPDTWTQPVPGLYYHPYRLGNTNRQRVLELCRQYMTPMPISIQASKGFLSTMLRTENGITVQFLAEDYDVDIDHRLDEMRYHRSRVNLLTKIEPVGTDGILCFETQRQPIVYTPFCEGRAKITQDGDICTVRLPEKCSYAVAFFPNR